MHSQFGEQRVLEQSVFVAGQKEAFVGAEVLNECVRRVSILVDKHEHNIITDSSPVSCGFP